MVNWRNDNMSALSWVTNNMANSKAAQLAFLTYTWVGLMTGCRVELAQHIPGVSMGFVDKLSRFMPTPELDGFEDWSKLLPTKALDNLFLGCNPIFANEKRLDSWSKSVSSVIAHVSKCLSDAWDIK